jgi:pimeloyl-ACP methyl ester carboxylesterase
VRDRRTQRPAERFINADPGAWCTATAKHVGPEAYEDYWRAIHNPDTVRAMMEDYRAGLGIDREHDEADRAAGRRISCPVLFLWARGTTWKISTATRWPSGASGPRLAHRRQRPRREAAACSVC